MNLKHEADLALQRVQDFVDSGGDKSSIELGELGCKAIISVNDYLMSLGSKSFIEDR